ADPVAPGGGDEVLEKLEEARIQLVATQHLRVPRVIRKHARLRLDHAEMQRHAHHGNTPLRMRTQVLVDALEVCPDAELDEETRVVEPRESPWTPVQHQVAPGDADPRQRFG